MRVRSGPYRCLVALIFALGALAPMRLAVAQDTPAPTHTGAGTGSGSPAPDTPTTPTTTDKDAGAPSTPSGGGGGGSGSTPSPVALAQQGYWASLPILLPERGSMGVPSFTPVDSIAGGASATIPLLQNSNTPRPPVQAFVRGGGIPAGPFRLDIFGDLSTTYAPTVGLTSDGSQAPVFGLEARNLLTAGVRATIPLTPPSRVSLRVDETEQSAAEPRRLLDVPSGRSLPAVPSYRNRMSNAEGSAEVNCFSDGVFHAQVRTLALPNYGTGDSNLDRLARASQDCQRDPNSTRCNERSDDFFDLLTPDDLRTPQIAQLLTSLVDGSSGQIIIRRPGLVQGTAVGTATLTVARAPGDPQRSESLVQVSPVQLLHLTVTTSMARIPIGADADFQVTGSYSDGVDRDVTQFVTWSSSDTSIARAPSARVQAVAAGSVTITATLGSVSGTATLTVTAAATPASVTIFPQQVTTSVGESPPQFRAVARYDDGSTADVTRIAQWSSAQPSVVTAVQEGRGNPVGVGTTTITARVGDLSGSATATVTRASLVSIAVVPPHGDIPLGQTVAFSAIGLFDDGTSRDVTASVAWTAPTPTSASSQPSTDRDDDDHSTLRRFCRSLVHGNRKEEALRRMISFNRAMLFAGFRVGSTADTLTRVSIGWEFGFAYRTGTHLGLFTSVSQFVGVSDVTLETPGGATVYPQTLDLQMAVGLQYSTGRFIGDNAVHVGLQFAWTPMWWHNPITGPTGLLPRSVYSNRIDVMGYATLPQGAIPGFSGLIGLGVTVPYSLESGPTFIPVLTVIPGGAAPIASRR